MCIRDSPILDQLARLNEAQGGPIEGVRALFLYPLNALIQSQQERLHAWTGPFAGDIRFCLYNGCLLYTSDAADERSSVDLGGRRIIKQKHKKKKKKKKRESYIYESCVYFVRRVFN